MSDIVERLRGWSGQGSPVSSTDIYAMTQEAADDIERLRKTAIETMHEMLRRATEIERWRSRFEKLQTVTFGRAAEIERLQVENKRLRGWIAPDILELTAEIERLRAKIKKYEDEQCGACRAYREIDARRALEPKP